MNWFRLKTCIKCQGDLAADNGDWLCLQCGTYYYTGLYELHPHIDDGRPASNPSAPDRSEKQIHGAASTTLSAATQEPESIVAATMVAAAAL